MSYRFVQRNAYSFRSFSLFGAKVFLALQDKTKRESKSALLICVHILFLLESKKGSSFYFERNAGLKNLWHNFITSCPAFLPRNGGTVFISGRCKLSEMSTTGIKKQTMNQVPLVCHTLFCQKYIPYSGGCLTWKHSELCEISEIWYFQCFFAFRLTELRAEYLNKNKKTTGENR